MFIVEIALQNYLPFEIIRLRDRKSVFLSFAQEKLLDRNVGKLIFFFLRLCADLNFFE